jgi:uncharacterized protein (TIGR03032 family)
VPASPPPPPGPSPPRSPAAAAAERSARSAPPVRLRCTPGFLDWLAAEDLSLAFTTYQTNRLFFVGRTRDAAGRPRLSGFERLLDRPMGLAAQPDGLWVATRYQLWRFDQVLAAGEEHEGYDRLYVPRTGHVTGEVDAHDVAVTADGDVVFVNTLYSCLARLSPDHSFEPLWRPPFVGGLTAEDRCHLNGMALENGRPRYVTAAAASDRAGGWREERDGGGVVVDVASSEIVASGFAMPHSPRIHRGELWVLDSGRGDLGRVDRETGRFEPICFLPGYLRGVALHGDVAVVGLSKPRDETFHGLPLDGRLEESGEQPVCGLRVVELATGRVLHGVDLEGVVVELYDVAVLPGARRPMALGFRDDEVRRTITFVADGEPVRHHLRRLETGQALPGGTALPGSAPTAAEAAALAASGAAEGFAAAAPPAQGGPGAVEVRLAALPLAEALRRHHLTFPDVRRTSRGRPLGEPLVAAVAGTPERLQGLALGHVKPGTEQGEVISLWVPAEDRRRGIAAGLLEAMERGLASRGATAAELSFRAGWPSSKAMRRLVASLGWSGPEPRLRLGTLDERMEPTARRLRRPLPQGYEIFPWVELTPAEKRDIVERQRREPWYPPDFDPFALEDRLEPETSVGLRHVGEDGNARVVGWLVGHRVERDVVQHSRLWVEPGHRPLGEGLPLVIEAFLRQLDAGIRSGIFQADAANRKMEKLMNHFRHDLGHVDVLLRSSRRLGGR